MNADLVAGITAVVAVLVIGSIGRWIVFRQSKPRYGARELKMLTVLVSGLPAREALEVRATLGEAGIRSAEDDRWDGTKDVLVFYGDVERARTLL